MSSYVWNDPILYSTLHKVINSYYLSFLLIFEVIVFSSFTGCNLFSFEPLYYTQMVSIVIEEKIIDIFHVFPLQESNLELASQDEDPGRHIEYLFSWSPYSNLKSAKPMIEAKFQIVFYM